MSDRDEVSEFVRRALSRGAAREAVEAELLEAGWAARDVSRAMETWGEARLGTPVPRPRPFVSPREAFLYGLMFLALIVTCIVLAQLAFSLIDRLVPDPVQDRYWNASSIRWSMATLAVFFPTFAFLSWKAETARPKEEGARISPVRKWLGYLGLFGAALALLGSAVSVIYGFLEGALTLRFILKAATVAAIAGAVFALFRRDTREDRA